MHREAMDSADVIVQDSDDLEPFLAAAAVNPAKQDADQFKDLFEFVVEGVLLSVVCVLGFLGNCLAIYVLLKPSMRGAFSTLLTALVSFDALFLVCSFFTFGLSVLSDHYKQTYFYPLMPFWYSFLHITRLCSGYATVCVTVERFFAIVYPFKAFEGAKRFLMPATITFAVIFNVPKFFELTTQSDKSTGRLTVVGTPMRTNAAYKLYYLFWAKLLFTELVPYVTIVVLNSAILVKIVQSSRFRRNMNLNSNSSSSPKATTAASQEERLRSLEKQRQEHRLGIILIAISVLFIFCQLFKVIPDLYESVYCSDRGTCEVGVTLNIIVDFSHLLTCINSSLNFLIYLLGGKKFRRAWVSAYCGCCFRSGTDDDGGNGGGGGGGGVNGATAFGGCSRLSVPAVAARGSHHHHKRWDSQKLLPLNRSNSTAVAVARATTSPSPVVSSEMI